MSRLVVVPLVVVLSVGFAWGQYGTLHLPSAVPWPQDSVQISGQVRAFEGSENLIYDASARGGVSHNVEVRLGWFSMSTEGQDPIADAVRRSELHLLTLSGLWQVQEGNWRVAFRGGGEFPTRRIQGINTDTGDFAPQLRAIPVIGGIIEHGDPEGTLLIFEAKGVGWDADMAVNGVGDNVVEGFGNLFILGLGAVHNFGTGRVFADVAYPLSGDNSINEVTNATEQALVWSAGASYTFSGRCNPTLIVGVTNAAGPTAATSTLAAPGDSAGVVGGFSLNW